MGPKVLHLMSLLPIGAVFLKDSIFGGFSLSGLEREGEEEKVEKERERDREREKERER